MERFHLLLSKEHEKSKTAYKVVGLSSFSVKLFVFKLSYSGQDLAAALNPEQEKHYEIFIRLFC